MKDEIEVQHASEVSTGVNMNGPIKVLTSLCLNAAAILGMPCAIALKVISMVVGKTNDVQSHQTIMARGHVILSHY